MRLWKLGHGCRKGHTYEMYWGGENEKGSIGGEGGCSGTNRLADHYWSFEEEEEEQSKSGSSNNLSLPNGSTFMQSLLDLQGFCAEAKSEQKRRNGKYENKNKVAQDNCLCLLHQILIKVIEEYDYLCYGGR